MLSPLDLYINCFVALVLLPLALYSLATGSQPPQHPGVGKFYRAEKHLMLISNVFLLSLCATTIPKLAQHFGFMDTQTAERLGHWISVPFLALLVVFLALMVRAILKVRREEKAV